MVANIYATVRLRKKNLNFFYTPKSPGGDFKYRTKRFVFYMQNVIES